MELWTVFVELVRQILFVLAVPLGGNLGAAIVVLSVGVRLALLPMTLRLAIKAQEIQRTIRDLAPELERLERRHAADPVRLARETQALYKKHGVRVVPSGMMTSLAIQAPIGAGLYQAITQGLARGGRFLWVADLARPDLVVALIAAGLGALAALVTAAGTPEHTARGASILSGVVTFFLAWRLSAGLGLYWAASALVGLVQAVLVRRHRPVDAKA
jgi:YidC/Oxa1 family membrane protein insertase